MLTLDTRDRIIRTSIDRVQIYNFFGRTQTESRASILEPTSGMPDINETNAESIYDPIKIEELDDHLQDYKRVLETFAKTGEHSRYNHDSHKHTHS